MPQNDPAEAHVASSGFWGSSGMAEQRGVPSATSTTKKGPPAVLQPEGPSTGAHCTPLARVQIFLIHYLHSMSPCGLWLVSRETAGWPCALASCPVVAEAEDTGVSVPCALSSHQKSAGDTGAFLRQHCKPQSLFKVLPEGARSFQHRLDQGSGAGRSPSLFHTHVAWPNCASKFSAQRFVSAALPFPSCGTA